MDEQLDPETEKALRDAMDEAADEVRDDGITNMAAYMRRSYEAFRKCGFSRRQSFSFTMVLYQSLLSRG
jgi:hypothetical protein